MANYYKFSPLFKKKRATFGSSCSKKTRLEEHYPRIYVCGPQMRHISKATKKPNFFFRLDSQLCFLFVSEQDEGSPVKASQHSDEERWDAPPPKPPRVRWYDTLPQLLTRLFWPKCCCKRNTAENEAHVFFPRFRFIYLFDAGVRRRWESVCYK